MIVCFVWDSRDIDDFELPRVETFCLGHQPSELLIQFLIGDFAILNSHQVQANYKY